MWKKFSEIFEGSASTDCFSKKATSYFIKASRYNDLSLNVIFSACCYMIVYENQAKKNDKVHKTIAI